MKLSDESARQAALDIRHSVIVQAPAGSGKTELLCQRFLAALAKVEQPEQVLAVTFTRKAAKEMRERILGYLRDPSNFLAQEVLQQNQKYQWKIETHPERLSIMTIDSLCAKIVDQAPISTAMYGYRITELPVELYRAATIALLEDADKKYEWQNALHALLLQCDNRWQKLQSLLIDMLAKREQWLMLLPEVYDATEWRKRLEKNLKECAQEAFEVVKKKLSSSLMAELKLLMEFAIQQGAISAVEINEENFWSLLPRFVLTQEGRLRKTVDKRMGFPTGEKDQKEFFKTQKQRMLTALDELAETPGMEAALSYFSRVPPSEYSDAQWERVLIILQVLRALLAYWQLTIQKTNEIDFTEIALKALMVLGREGEPTELALALDYRLQHILVDEFQDTSLLQYKLLERLTQAWQEGDGRTLFFVGDPLQSIYRFRQAEVGLFIRVWQQGFGTLRLVPVQLTQNFRSQQMLVDFYNDKLACILPATSAMQEGAVAYVPVIAMQPPHSYEKNAMIENENKLIAQLEMLHAAYPKAKMAILVRSRTHLQDILPQLKAKNMAYQARDLMSLAEQPVIIDLMSWLKALLNLEDRLAWLSILNAPWLKISTALLQSLFEQDHRLVWARLLEWQQQLLKEENTELQKFISLWDAALNTLQKQPLDQLLYRLWAAAGAHEYWVDSLAREAEQKFWKILQTYQEGNDLPQLARFEAYVNQQAFSTQEDDAWLEVMTIHKAKGLEFDFVFLPSLEKVGQHDEHPLLVFDEIILSTGPKFLLAPLRERGDEEDAIFEFIWQLQKTKTHHERLRALYVACTRAKQGLYFYTEATIEGEKPRHGSFLWDLWPLTSLLQLDYSKI